MLVWRLKKRNHIEIIRFLKCQIVIKPLNSVWTVWISQFRSVLENFLSSLIVTTNQFIKSTILEMLWGIWFAKNQNLWDVKILSPAIAMSWSSKQVTKWYEAKKNKKNRGSQVCNQGATHQKDWSSPAKGAIKVNMDASIYSGAEFYFVGMETRDHRGQFIRCKIMKMAGSVLVEEAEMAGTQEEMQWLYEFPEYHIINESGSLICVNAINKPT